MTHDDGRQPIAIGYLSDSGDLKLYSYEIEGSCPFKLRPKLLSLTNRANEDFPIKF